MREILFRGQTRRYGEKLLNVAGDKMPSNWVYGGICKGDGDKSIIYGSNAFPDLRPFDKYVVYTDTIGQYTGLTDKNGNKIFEGDILRFYNGEEFSNYEVIWFGNAYKVLMEGEMEIQDDLDLFFCEHSEVIGNIHDNPELLEESNE